MRDALVGVVLLAVVAGCGKSRPSNVSAPRASSSAGETTASGDEDGGAPMDPSEAEVWAQAGTGEEPELARLVDRVGCEGLRERAATRALRGTAIRAMAYCPDLSELPWLAEIAANGQEPDPSAALVAILEQAARPRRAVDPEDADELHAGCAALLTLARAPGQPAPRRVLAIRALRMLAERGCVRTDEIPRELYAK